MTRKPKSTSEGRRFEEIFHMPKKTFLALRDFFNGVAAVEKDKAQFICGRVDSYLLVHRYFKEGKMVHRAEGIQVLFGNCLCNLMNLLNFFLHFFGGLVSRRGRGCGFMGLGDVR
jgi:hypothetical protein